MAALDPLGPRTIRPRPQLHPHVSFFGYWDHRTDSVHRSRALPRGALTLVIDVSGSDDVDFFAADGFTRAATAPAFAIGAGTQSYVTSIAPHRAVLTVHFKPGGATPFLGMPAGELRDRCVGIDALWGGAAVALRERLVEAKSVAHRVALLETFLLSRRDSGFGIHSGVSTALSVVDADPTRRVREIQAASGLTPKAFATMFRAQVGLAPKAYQRVRRLQAALRRLAHGDELGAEIAAGLGYFDQPHFVREFRAFAHTTPTEYLRSRSTMPGHVDVAGVPT